MPQYVFFYELYDRYIVNFLTLVELYTVSKNMLKPKNPLYL